MRYPTIPKTAVILRQGTTIYYSFTKFMDEFIWLDRRWSKDPKFRKTYDEISESLAAAPEGEVFELESKDFENLCEVLQDWPPQGLQVIPDIVRPTRKMINAFVDAPTEDPRPKSNGKAEEKKVEEKKDSTQPST